MIFKSNKGKTFSQEEAIDLMVSLSATDINSERKWKGFYNSLSLDTFLFVSCTPIDSLNPDASIPVGIAMAAIPKREVIDAIIFPTAVTGIEST